MIQADDVFSAGDFESIRLSVYFTNVTTRMEAKDPKKNQLVEIGDKWLVFELPAKCCAAKHSVLVEIRRVEQGKKKETDLLSVTGKVHAIQDLGDDRYRVTVECIQYDEQEWSNLVGLYSNRQAEIEKFFAAVKG